MKYRHGGLAASKLGNPAGTLKNTRRDVAVTTVLILSQLQFLLPYVPSPFCHVFFPCYSSRARRKKPFREHSRAPREMVLDSVDRGTRQVEGGKKAGTERIINIGGDYRSISTGYPVVISERTRIGGEPPVCELRIRRV